MIVFKKEYTQEQLNIIAEISKNTGISNRLAEVLYGRGVTDCEKAARFLSPGKNNFLNPFLLGDMRVTTDRLIAAKKADETVVVFGDYDADGICASTIMYRALKEFGIENVYTVIPERAQGYGLTHELVEQMLEEYNPDLVITVDCGVSCKEEISYIEDVGIDVIVTDHHELPDELPDCPLINCKRKDQEYPFEYLCGAGVAYKVAYALLGTRADRFLDLVAVATIADSMPLIGENRDLVAEGIKLVRSSPCVPIAALLTASGVKDLTSTGLAFGIVPRINAAGRMGNAHCALELMMCESEYEARDLCKKLAVYNSARQSECDSLLKSAHAKLAKKSLREVIVLKDDEWNGGLVGIAAAKLVEEYNRPVVLFTLSGGAYHGSARSAGEINVFKAVCYCKDLLIDFGGHANAAGVTVSAENFEAFENAICEFVRDNYGESAFEKQIFVEELITEKLSHAFIKELELLEPVGSENKKPLYAVELRNINAQTLKEGSPHVSFRTEYLDMTYFYGERDLDLLNFPIKKMVAFEPSVSVFNGKEYFKGFVRAVDFFSPECDFETDGGAKNDEEKRLELECFKNYLTGVFENCKPRELLDNGAIAALIEKTRASSDVIFAAVLPKTLNEYSKILKLEPESLRPHANGGKNALVLSLKYFENLGYKKIIYLDEPLFGYPEIKGIENVVIADRKAFELSLDVSRKTFAKCFMLLKNNSFYGKSSADVALCIKDDELSSEQIVFCLEVFIELKIFYFSQGALLYDKSVKSDLNASKLYRAVCELTQG